VQMILGSGGMAKPHSQKHCSEVPRLERQERKDKPRPQIIRDEFLDELKHSGKRRADLAECPSRGQKADGRNDYAHKQVGPRKSTEINVK